MPQIGFVLVDSGDLSRKVRTWERAVCEPSFGNVYTHGLMKDMTTNSCDASSCCQQNVASVRHTVSVSGRSNLKGQYVYLERTERARMKPALSKF